MHIFKSLNVALGFLTIISFGKNPFSELREVGKAAWAFPVVGLLLGSVLALIYFLFEPFLPPGVVALIVVGSWIFLTGGLHLDGWTDCWDAFGASVTKERRREILKDSRLGAFGAMALFLILGLKIACLASGLVSYAELMLAAVTGRSLLIAGFKNYGSMNPGMASSFASGVDSSTYMCVWVLTLPVVLMCGLVGIAAFLAACVGVIFFRRFAEKKLGFINGDVLGASCELSETLVLIVASWR